MDSLYVPLWLVYDVMSYAILHIIMFHTPAHPILHAIYLYKIYSQ